MKLHLFVILGLIIWKIISADWIMGVPWRSAEDGHYPVSGQHIKNIPGPNSPIWNPPLLVFDENHPRYRSWFNSIAGYWESTGATHATGRGTLRIDWHKIIVKIISCYALFLFFYILVKMVKKTDEQNS